MIKWIEQRALKMKEALSMLVVAASLVGVVVLTPPLWNTPSDYERYAPSIVMLTDESGYGHATGWVIAPGLVLTNAHVAEFDLTNVTFGNGDTATGSYLWRTEVNVPGPDLALLRVDTGDREPLPVNCDPVKADAEVTVIGHMGTTRWNITRGRISSLYAADIQGASGADTYFVLNVAAGPGSSGSPVLDENGEVIGVINSGIPPHTMFAVSNKTLCAALAR